jgi:hypothetical protein
MALPGGSKRARRSVKDHYVIDEPRRHPKMPGSLPIAVAFLHKRNDTRTQLDRKRLAHGGSPSMAKVNHKSTKCGILNLVRSDTL